MSVPWTDLAFPDRAGRLRLVSVASDELASAVAAVRIDPTELGWAGVEGPLTLDPDDTIYPSPWDPSRCVRLCFLLGPDGEPSAACGRRALARAIARAEAAGLKLVAAAEVELFLLRPDGTPVYDAVENYGMVAGAPYEGVMGAVRGLRRFGVPVMATNPEYGGGQFEINLRHGPGMTAADSVAMVKTWTAVAAAREGLGATFLAKPWPGGSGSGMHVHQSLWRGEENVFWSRPEELSAVGRSYLAGLLTALPELAPLGSPTAAGYTRRADGSFCPVNVSWGGDNRTVAVRVIAEDEPTTRIEQRDAAVDANPYLVVAGQVHAGLDGVEAGLQPPEAVTGNAYAQPDLPPLPRTLADAMPLFEGSALARRVLGEEGHAVLCRALSIEAEAGLAGVAGRGDPDGAW